MNAGVRRIISSGLAAVAMLLGVAPAQAATVERVTVEASDGVELAGWVLRPEVAGKKGKPAKVPVIVISIPYIGQCIAAGAAGAPCWPAPETPEKWAIHNEPVDHLLDRGYALAYFSVRGTGLSGGCIDDMGPREQRDSRELIEWAAEQPWSSGRVAMMGISYMSGTALGGAIQRPKALKTIVIGGVVGDLYTYNYTPQGLASSGAAIGYEAAYLTDISLLPAGAAQFDPAMTLEALQHQGERFCPEVVRAMTEAAKGTHTGVRDSRFWLDRRLSDDYGRIRASVLIAHGLQDHWGSGHAMQEDAMWSKIRAPKAMYLGQWGHNWPWQEGHWRMRRADLKNEWHAMLDAWLGHYLKGGPKPKFLGTVRYEDQGGGFNTSKAWPPKESRPEALYLTPGGSLSGKPATAEGGETFRAYPQADKFGSRTAFLCASAASPVAGRGSLVYMTEPVKQKTVIAGNPMAYLDLTADQAGGGFQVVMYDLAPDFACGGPTGGSATGATALTFGGADLQFHHGGFDARRFTGGHVRVDLANLSYPLATGHRLAVVVSYGDPNDFDETRFTPNITVRSGPRADASQIVIPVRGGGLGGSAPATTYPPRP